MTLHDLLSPLRWLLLHTYVRACGALPALHHSIIKVPAEFRHQVPRLLDALMQLTHLLKLCVKITNGASDLSLASVPGCMQAVLLRCLTSEPLMQSGIQGVVPSLLVLKHNLDVAIAFEEESGMVDMLCEAVEDPGCFVRSLQDTSHPEHSDLSLLDGVDVVIGALRK